MRRKGRIEKTKGREKELPLTPLTESLIYTFASHTQEWLKSFLFQGVHIASNVGVDFVLLVFVLQKISNKQSVYNNDDATYKLQ